MSITQATQNPLCVPLKKAAELLSRHPEVIRRELVKTGEITAVRSSGDKKGSRIFLMFDEINAFAEGGLEGLRAFRAKHKRKTPKK